MSQTAEPELHYLEYYEDFLAKVRILSRKVRESGWMPDFVIGVGRGGLVPAVYISHQRELPMLSIDHSSKVPGFADELLGSVAGASTEMDPRQVRAPLNPSRPRATVLYLCGWGEAAACDAAKELAAADDACAALRAKTPFGPGGGSPRPHSSSSRPAKRPSTPAPELRGPPPKRPAPLPKKPAAKAKPAPGTSGPLGGWARIAKKPRAPPPLRARAPPPPVAPTPAEPWTCANCTYHHADREATFLQCAMCGGTEKSAGPGEA